MPKITIDGSELEVAEDITVMKACQSAGIEIPHFCFHDRLKIAGNCRMCLVDIEKSPKPVASCAMPVIEGMVIRTNTQRVKKAREGVMEFLLINHPLDCPICDQGGECDLQDQAFKYGNKKSRYSENKRAVNNKDLGPLVKTEMTRCIHCTRCIRFATDIAGVPEIGAIGRGEDMEITSYLEKTLTSELSGNIIDLCPVGALTSKPYAFKARSWELEKTNSIDVMDAVGSAIRIDSRGPEVMRIVPRINEEINEEWLSDKARFAYDGLKNQRLDRPYIRKNNKFVEASWEQAIDLIAKQFSKIEKKSKIAAIAGTLASCEAMFLLKNLLKQLGSDLCDANQFGYKFDLSNRGNYLFNTTIAGIEKADFCLLVGANPRQIAPVLNARIGKMVREDLLKVARIGEIDDQTYDILELGENPEILANPKSELTHFLSAAKNPMIIVGDAVLRCPDAYEILSAIHNLINKYNIVGPDWNGFNILHNHASIVGALDLGFIDSKDSDGCLNILQKTNNGDVDILYLLGADEIDITKIGKDTFVIYQGHHGDVSVNRADVILPEAAYTEQDGIYVNLEGRAQLAKQAAPMLSQAKTSIEIINMVANSLEIGLGDMSLEQVRNLMAQQYEIFANIDKIVNKDFTLFNKNGQIKSKSLPKIKINYYMTDSISRSSVTMAKCTQALAKI